LTTIDNNPETQLVQVPESNIISLRKLKWPTSSSAIEWTGVEWFRKLISTDQRGFVLGQRGSGRTVLLNLIFDELDDDVKIISGVSEDQFIYELWSELEEPVPAINWKIGQIMGSASRENWLIAWDGAWRCRVCHNYCVLFKDIVSGFFFPPNAEDLRDGFRKLNVVCPMLAQFVHTEIGKKLIDSKILIRPADDLSDIGIGLLKELILNTHSTFILLTTPDQLGFIRKKIPITYDWPAFNLPNPDINFFTQLVKEAGYELPPQLVQLSALLADSNILNFKNLITQAAHIAEDSITGVNLLNAANFPLSDDTKVRIVVAMLKHRGSEIFTMSELEELLFQVFKTVRSKKLLAGFLSPYVESGRNNQGKKYRIISSAKKLLKLGA
jgi:hypothetical protein